MTNSLAERSILEVVRRCGLILTASGYNTNIGANVLRAKRSVDITNSAPNAVVVWDAGDTATRSDGSVDAYKVELTISVEVHTQVNQSNTGVLISAMKADVKRAVLSGSSGKLSDATGDIGKIAYAGSTQNPVESGSATEFMVVSFVASYVEAYGNPDSAQRLNINP